MHIEKGSSVRCFLQLHPIQDDKMDCREIVFHLGQSRTMRIRQGYSWLALLIRLTNETATKFLRSTELQSAKPIIIIFCRRLNG
jgi:hypothetical protein